MSDVEIFKEETQIEAVFLEIRLIASLKVILMLSSLRL